MSGILTRQKAKYDLGDAENALNLKIRMLSWSQQFGIRIFLDNNGYPQPMLGYECLLAVGVDGNGRTAATLDELQILHDKSRDWIFGHIAYDYKNNLEPKLSSSHGATSGFPLSHFFVPQTVCYIDSNLATLTIESFSDPDAIWREIGQSEHTISPLPHLTFRPVVTKEKYLETIQQLRRHIAAGDCYEINYCTQGHCSPVELEPLDTFLALNKISPAPFACFYQLDSAFMMCASPERYLKKFGDKIISQPIKGTARRSNDVATDNQIKEALRNDIKERAENVMIVDLVRNDIARSSEVGSVQVDELFGIYSYPQVHQMMSTVSGTLRKGVPFTDAIRYSFPMGSMTGAPKHKVMQLIEQYECSRRELFSGTVGYITPGGDFDFNVVIRSLFYNADTQFLSYQTGGAITFDSLPEKEWEEMRLKAWALERIFA